MKQTTHLWQIFIYIETVVDKLLYDLRIYLIFDCYLEGSLTLKVFLFHIGFFIKQLRHIMAIIHHNSHLQ